MVNNPFKKESAEQQSQGAEAPPALQAFTSRFLSRKTVQLTPDEIAQKIATLLRPGPPFYSKVQNSDLIANLSDASIMNSAALNPPKVALSTGADSSPATDKPWTASGTVWTALEGLPSGNKTYEIPGSSTVTTFANDDDDEDDGLWSALMVTCDLDCKDVSLAKSVVVPTKVLHENNYYKGNNQALKLIGVGKQYQWDDFNTFNNTLPSSVKVQSFQFLSPSIDMWSWPSWVPFLGDKKDDPKKDDPKSGGDDSDADSKKKKRVWIPSTTKVSFRAAWWGFTIALPPPIMAELDRDAAQAEKIANMINTALNYILNNLPALPAGFLPIITVLKAIAPVTGYLSTFIGWSWSELKSFDQGKGIELSATWILPVALIPRSWDSPTEDPDQDGDQDPKTPTQDQDPKTPTQDPSQPQDGDQDPKTPAQDPKTPVQDPSQPSQPQDGDQDPSQPNPVIPAPVEDDDENKNKEKAPTKADPVPVPAPGATLPPTNPTDADLEPTVPKPATPVLNDKLGRGGDKNPISQAPMGDSPPYVPSQDEKQHNSEL